LLDIDNQPPGRWSVRRVAVSLLAVGMAGAFSLGLASPAGALLPDPDIDSGVVRPWPTVDDSWWTPPPGYEDLASPETPVDPAPEPPPAPSEPPAPTAPEPAPDPVVPAEPAPTEVEAPAVPAPTEPGSPVEPAPAGIPEPAVDPSISSLPALFDDGSDVPDPSLDPVEPAETADSAEFALARLKKAIDLAKEKLRAPACNALISGEHPANGESAKEVLDKITAKERGIINRWDWTKRSSGYVTVATTHRAGTGSGGAISFYRDFHTNDYRLAYGLDGLDFLRSLDPPPDINEHRAAAVLHEVAHLTGGMHHGAEGNPLFDKDVMLICLRGKTPTPPSGPPRGCQDCVPPDEEDRSLPPPEREDPCLPESDLPEVTGPFEEVPTQPDSPAPDPATPEPEDPCLPESDLPVVTGPFEEVPDLPDSDLPEVTGPFEEVPDLPDSDLPEVSGPFEEVPDLPDSDFPEVTGPFEEVPDLPDSDFPEMTGPYEEVPDDFGWIDPDPGEPFDPGYGGGDYTDPGYDDWGGGYDPWCCSGGGGGGGDYYYEDLDWIEAEYAELA